MSAGVGRSVTAVHLLLLVGSDVRVSARPSVEVAPSASSPTSLSRARCWTTALTAEANGTAIRAPAMPASRTPQPIATMTPSGWTDTNRPIRNGCSTWPSICCTRITPPSISSAVIGPWSTSATSTATVPASVAPTIGTNAPRNTSTPMASTNGTPRTAATIMMPIASTAATRTVARTNWVRLRQATRPLLSTRSRAARGASRTSQAQIRSPSARKK